MPLYHVRLRGMVIIKADSKESAKTKALSNIHIGGFLSADPKEVGTEVDENGWDIKKGEGNAVQEQA